VAKKAFKGIASRYVEEMSREQVGSTYVRDYFATNRQPSEATFAAVLRRDPAAAEAMLRKMKADSEARVAKMLKVFESAKGEVQNARKGTKETKADDDEEEAEEEEAIQDCIDEADWERLPHLLRATSMTYEDIWVGMARTYAGRLQRDERTGEVKPQARELSETELRRRWRTPGVIPTENEPLRLLAFAVYMRLDE
jgi:DNA-binding FadR family transcriptional regulator